MKHIINLLVLLFLFCMATPANAENNQQQKTVFHAIVAQDGSGNFTTVQDAIDAVPENLKAPWLIFIKNGSYQGTVTIPENKPFIHLIGQDKEKTVIHEKLHVGGKPNPENQWFKNDSAAWEFSIRNPQSLVYKKQGSVVLVGSPDFYAESISFVNDFGVESQTGPQALAIKLGADKNAFKNCIFRSYQDTWQTSSKDEHRLYVKDTRIEGAVDYFYGGGDALVENSTFYNVRSGSVIVAPNHRKAAYGYVFRNCIVDGNKAAADGKQKLGRPWHNAPKTIYIHTTMRIPIAPEGWTNMGSIPELFAEYDSRDAEGNVLDLSQRKTEYEGRGKEAGKGSCRATITKEEADKMIYENIILHNGDNWDPRRIMEALSAPGKLKRNRMNLSWEAVSGATGYIVYDGETILGITAEPVWTLSANPQSSVQVCAVSANGTLGEKATLKLVTVHTIGDSTMADYVENTTKTRGWGEMLQEFFSPEVEVMNYARGGRSSRSLYQEGIWNRVKSNLSTGDYVLIQFAHNDEKEGGKDGADGRGTAPWTTYKSYLEKYVDETRALGGIPVFVSPIIRRYFDKTGKITPKGCHDLSIAPDDSTLNYVRVMKQVARNKKAQLVDMTALTKNYVEQLGEEATVRQLYVPTDGTHTQATGAAVFARLAAEELKRQGILAPYIRTEIPMVLNPTSLNFGTVYVGDKATLSFDLTGLNLSPETGVLSLLAPEGMALSQEPNAQPQQKVYIPYTDAKLWNQSFYLHVNPTSAGNLSSSVIISTNGQPVRELPVKASGKEIAQRTDVIKKQSEIVLKGLKAVNNSYTIESGTWPADIDEAANRYVDFIIRNGEKTLVVQQLSFSVKGNVSYRVAYARGKDFFPRTDIGENQNAQKAAGDQTFPVNTSLMPNERLHIRFLPWNPSGGEMSFNIENLQIKGIEIE